MILFKKSNSKEPVYKIIKNIFLKFKIKIIMILILIITLFFYSIFLLELEKFYNIYSKHKLIAYKSFEIFNNNLKSRFVNIENFDLQIKDINLKKINYLRELSTKAYISDNLKQNNDLSRLRKDTWVPAKLSNGKKYMMLKSDLRVN